MRASSFEKFTFVRFAWVAMALPLMGCEWLIKPCAPDLLNTPENQAKSAFGCYCTLEQKADPEHLCCSTAGTCSDESGIPDPETSDPAGTLSIGVFDVRTEPLNEASSACDGGTAKFDFKWEYRNLVNGSVGAWSEYGLVEQPQFVVDKFDVVGPPVLTSDAGWAAMAVNGEDPHKVPVDLPAGHYVGSISKLPLRGVQNATAATERNVADLQEGDPWHDTICSAGGAGG